MFVQVKKTTNVWVIIPIVLGSTILLYFTFASDLSLRTRSIAYAYDEIQPIEEKYLSSNNDTGSDNSTNTSVTEVPKSAKGPTIPAKGYLVEEIGDNLYWLTDGKVNTMFLVTDEGVVAVDAPPMIGNNYLKAIREVTDKPITHVIYSHAHLDHIGAAGIFPVNATYVAHEDTAAELQRALRVSQNTSKLPPLPTTTFSQNHTLHFRNQTLNLDYHGNNHLAGNIFIYAPHQKVLMLVDVIQPGWVPYVYLELTDDTAGFIIAHDTVLNNYDFDTLVAGHSRLGTRNDVIIQKNYIYDLQNAAAKANREVLFSDATMAVKGSENTWLLLSKYFDAINQNCVESMLPKWQGKLGGVEQFISTHCFTMTQDGRIDPTLNAILQNSTLLM